MQWNSPKKDEKITRTFFAFLPFVGKKTYWLEFVTVVEQYHVGYDDFWEIIGIIGE